LCVLIVTFILVPYLRNCKCTIVTSLFFCHTCFWMHLIYLSDVY